MFFYLLLLFTLVPVLEIWILIRIGQAIDVGPTIGLIILTGVVGAALARREGMRVLLRINESLSRGQMPANEVIEGLMIFVAGIALVTPGIVTDTIGFAVLIPPIRAWLRRRLVRYFKARIVVTGAEVEYSHSLDDDFIDVECHDVTDEHRGELEDKME